MQLTALGLRRNIALEISDDFPEQGQIQIENVGGLNSIANSWDSGTEGPVTSNSTLDSQVSDVVDETTLVSNGPSIVFSSTELNSNSSDLAES